MFAAPLPNWLIHVHGAAFTLWILLLVTQTLLVPANRVDFHKKLGIAPRKGPLRRDLRVACFATWAQDLARTIRSTLVQVPEKRGLYLLGIASPCSCGLN